MAAISGLSYIEIMSLGFPLVHCHCVGDEYDYNNLVWESGAPLPSQQTLDEWVNSNDNELADKRITVLAFRNRFTKTEKIMIELASIDNPNVNIEQRQMAAALRVDLKDTDTATFIDLNRQDTRAGVMTLEYYGVIQPGRALQILDNPVQAHERPLNL